MLLTPEAVKNSPVVAAGLNLRLELKDYNQGPGEKFREHGFARPFSNPVLLSENPEQFLEEVLELPTLNERWRMIYSITRRYIYNPHELSLAGYSYSFRWGPFSDLAKWSEPLLEAVYVSGLSTGRVMGLVDSSFGSAGISYATMWRHSAGKKYGQEYQDRVKLLHEFNKQEKLQASGGWVKQAPPIAWMVDVTGKINQATIEHLKELSERSQTNQRRGTLKFTLT